MPADDEGASGSASRIRSFTDHTYVLPTGAEIVDDVEHWELSHDPDCAQCSLVNFPTGECRPCPEPGCEAWDHSGCSEAPTVQTTSQPSFPHPTDPSYPAATPRTRVEPGDASALVGSDPVTTPQWNGDAYLYPPHVQVPQTSVPILGEELRSSATTSSAIPPVAYPSGSGSLARSPVSRTYEDVVRNVEPLTSYDFKYTASGTTPQTGFGAIAPNQLLGNSFGVQHTLPPFRELFGSSTYSLSSLSHNAQLRRKHVPASRGWINDAKLTIPPTPSYPAIDRMHRHEREDSPRSPRPPLSRNISSNHATRTSSAAEPANGSTPAGYDEISKGRRTRPSIRDVPERYARPRYDPRNEVLPRQITQERQLRPALPPFDHPATTLHAMSVSTSSNIEQSSTTLSQLQRSPSEHVPCLSPLHTPSYEVQQHNLDHLTSYTSPQDPSSTHLINRPNPIEQSAAGPVPETRTLVLQELDDFDHKHWPYVHLPRPRNSDISFGLVKPYTRCTACGICPPRGRKNWRHGPCGPATLCDPCGRNWRKELLATSVPYGYPKVKH